MPGVQEGRNKDRPPHKRTPRLGWPHALLPRLQRLAGRRKTRVVGIPQKRDHLSLLRQDVEAAEATHAPVSGTERIRGMMHASSRNGRGPKSHGQQITTPRTNFPLNLGCPGATLSAYCSRQRAASNYSPPLFFLFSLGFDVPYL